MHLHEMVSKHNKTQQWRVVGVHRGICNYPLLAWAIELLSRYLRQIIFSPTLLYLVAHYRSCSWCSHGHRVTHLPPSISWHILIITGGKLLISAGARPSMSGVSGRTRPEALFLVTFTEVPVIIGRFLCTVWPPEPCKLFSLSTG